MNKLIGCQFSRFNFIFISKTNCHQKAEQDWKLPQVSFRQKWPWINKSLRRVEKYELQRSKWSETDESKDGSKIKIKTGRSIQKNKSVGKEIIRRK